MSRLLWIGMGGFVGANLRYLVQGWAAERWGSHFPFGTLLANVSGAFVLAFFLTLVTERVALAPHWRLFLAVGMLGGYTTFSSLAFETLTLTGAGFWLHGVANVVGSLLLGLLAALLGSALARCF